VSAFPVQRVLLALAAIGLAVAPLLVAPFTVTLLNYIGIGALVALGLVLLTGFAGLTSFGQAALMGIGAYATAWLTTGMGASPWLGLLLALALTGTVAAILGAITLRLGGHFLPLSTIAWGIAIYFLFANIPGLGQHDGIKEIPPLSLGGLSLASNAAIYYLIWGILGAAMWLAANLLYSREGRAIRALRGGTTMIASLGVDLFRIRLVIFVLAALLAGLAGWLYAHMNRFVSPSPFEVRPSIDYLLMAMVGGPTSIYGAVAGAAVVTLLKNFFQSFLPHLSDNAGQLELVAFSLLLILILQHARGGLMGAARRLMPHWSMATPLPKAPCLPRRGQPEPGTPLLSVEGAVKRFGGLAAVNDVGFEVKAGEIVGLIGPNGAGKSTMFNLITGALAPSAGRVTFLGRNITNWSQQRIAAAGIARTFQHVKVRPTMTLLDNVLLGTYTRTRAGFARGALRLDRAEEAQAVAEARRQLERAGLGDKAEVQAGSLPLGSQRMLEVARALAADPVLIVLDEPAAGLRRAEKDALAEQLRLLRGDGVTILLVEHDMEFVMGLVDRIVVMDFGAKLMEGRPSEVRASPAVQEAYLGGVGGDVA
jgi:ABC-type branched-subunit amino acid transport system ATPase component/ABC-type branched-subunit amino acid transport system permease subunit